MKPEKVSETAQLQRDYERARAESFEGFKSRRAELSASIAAVVANNLDQSEDFEGRTKSSKAFLFDVAQVDGRPTRIFVRAWILDVDGNSSNAKGGFDFYSEVGPEDSQRMVRELRTVDGVSVAGEYFYGEALTNLELEEDATDVAKEDEIKVGILEGFNDIQDTIDRLELFYGEALGLG